MYSTVSSLVSRLPEMNDHRAWAVFNARYSPVLKQFFVRCGFTVDQSVDMTQDTIQRAIAGLKKGDFSRKKGRLRDWILGIARNVLRNQVRRKKLKTNIEKDGQSYWDEREDPAALEEFGQIEEEFDRIWVRARLSALLRVACKSFSKRDLRCYFLVEVHRLPIKVVAERLGMSEPNVFLRRRAVADWIRAVGPRFFERWER